MSLIPGPLVIIKSGFLLGWGTGCGLNLGESGVVVRRIDEVGTERKEVSLLVKDYVV